MPMKTQVPQEKRLQHPPLSMDSRDNLADLLRRQQSAREEHSRVIAHMVWDRPMLPQSPQEGSGRR